MKRDSFLEFALRVVVMGVISLALLVLMATFLWYTGVR